MGPPLREKKWKKWNDAKSMKYDDKMYEKMKKQNDVKIMKFDDKVDVWDPYKHVKGAIWVPLSWKKIKKRKMMKNETMQKAYNTMTKWMKKPFSFSLPGTFSEHT